MTQTNPYPAPRPPSPAGLLIWGAVLMASGIAIGAGGVSLIHHSPPPPPPHGMEESPPPGPGRRPPPAMDNPDVPPQRIVDELKVELKLDDTQSAKVLAAYTTSLDAINKLRQGMVVNLAAEHDKLRQALHDILTPLQFATWEERYESMRTRMMPGGPPLGRIGPHGGPGGGPPDGRGGRRGPGGPGGFGGPGQHGPGEFGGPMGGPDQRGPDQRRPGQRPAPMGRFGPPPGPDDQSPPPPPRQPGAPASAPANPPQ